MLRQISGHFGRMTPEVSGGGNWFRKWQATRARHLGVPSLIVLSRGLCLPTFRVRLGYQQTKGSSHRIVTKERGELHGVVPMLVVFNDQPDEGRPQSGGQVYSNALFMSSNCSLVISPLAKRTLRT